MKTFLQKLTKKSLIKALSLTGMILFAAGTARGDTLTWTGGGSDTNWSTPANWDNGTPTSGDTLVFSGTGATTNNDYVGATFTIHYAASAGAFTLAGNDLTLGGDIDYLGSDIADQTIDLNLSVPANFQVEPWAGNYFANMTINGNISGAETLFRSDGGGINLGSLTLNGTNTFAGNIQPMRGPIIFNSIANKSVPSALGVGDTIITGPNGGQAGNAYIYTGATSSSDRDIQIGTTASSRIHVTDADAALTLSGNITTNGNLTGDAGTLYLSSNDSNGSLNEISGNISDGTGATDDVVSIRLDAYTLPTSLGGATQNGFWKLSGNNTYTGWTDVRNSTVLVVGSDTALGADTEDTGTIVRNSAQIWLDGGVAVGAERLILTSNANADPGGLGLTGAALRSRSGTNSWAGTITLKQAAEIATDAGSFTLSGELVTEDNDVTIRGADGTTTTLSGEISGAGNLTKEGLGTARLTATNIYTGATTVNAGTLILATGGSITSNTSVAADASIGGGGTITGDLTLSEGANFFLTGDILNVTGNVLIDSSFGVASLVADDWSQFGLGEYTLIDGTATDFATLGLQNWGLENAGLLADGRKAFFQSGSLQLVIIPEPSSLLLLGLAGLALMRRRRRKGE